MKINESGRSMIEMLGVLAIIGVLSVGGIAGYSKAMTKYRENKTLDQVSHIIANTRILFGSQKDYSSLGANAAAAKDIIDKAKLFPTEMGSGGTYNNPFSGSVDIKVSGRFAQSDNKAAVLTYNGIPQEACIDLATIDWSTGSGGGVVAMGVNQDVSGIYTGAVKNTEQAGKVVYEGQGAMTVTNAVTACDKTNTNVLYFKFY